MPQPPTSHRGRSGSALRIGCPILTPTEKVDMVERGRLECFALVSKEVVGLSRKKDTMSLAETEKSFGESPEALIP